MIRAEKIGDHAEIAEMPARQGLPALHAPRAVTLTGNFSESSIRIRSKMLRCSLPCRAHRDQGRNKIQRKGRGGCAEDAGVLGA